jgi:anti-sigma regulatory factor (Ser/Thr protein kinase)
MMGQVPGSPRSTSKELRAGPRTPEEARLFLSEALERFDVDVDTGAARLLMSEIASNAVRHGEEPIDVSVSVEEQGLRVSVFDRGSGFDPDELRFDEDMSPEAWAEDGRGLKLVHALSSDWGVERSDEGTEVWFRL